MEEKHGTDYTLDYFTDRLANRLLLAHPPLASWDTAPCQVRDPPLPRLIEAGVH